jgi:cyclopropane-fatty-acyl-phospholipid synthase
LPEPVLPFENFSTFPGRARRNVVHHYDLKDSLFDQFLDPRRQYSCGYFHKASDTLADTQITKLARLGAKLCLQPNQQVLDIGCGWGGLANALW